jgi:hypothetical protein
VKTTCLRVREWATHFENNRTRELKYLDWVPVPNKHDGDGFTEIMDHESGVAHYGAWMLIVQVASKCEPRGTLLREGGKPYDAVSLARVTRASRKVFEEAIPRLLNAGWLESIPYESLGLTVNVASQCDVPASQCGKAPTERNGREGKGTEHAGEGERARDAVHRSSPSLLDVAGYAQTIGLAEWKARDWFEEMTAVGWIDWHHRPVRCWQSMLNRVRTKWEADGRPTQPPASRQANGGNGKPMSVLDLKSVIQVKEEKITKLKAKHLNEGPLGGKWESQAAFESYKKLKAEINRLKDELEKRG